MIDEFKRMSNKVLFDVLRIREFKSALFQSVSKGVRLTLYLNDCSIHHKYSRDSLFSTRTYGPSGAVIVEMHMEGFCIFQTDDRKYGEMYIDCRCKLNGDDFWDVLEMNSDYTKVGYREFTPAAADLYLRGYKQVDGGKYSDFDMDQLETDLIIHQL